MMATRIIRLALASALLAPLGAAQAVGVETAGAPGGPGLAVMTAKALVTELDGKQVVDHAVLLVRDGKIEAVAPRRDLPVPPGYVVLDVGDAWVMPGMIDLHSHVGGSRRDINDMVFQTNPGLRASPTVIPGNEALDLGVAAGVTTILYIPGSGTNMGGQGVLMKTASAGYEDTVIREPGSLKIAQGDNPKRWGFGMGRIAMAWNLKHQLRKGVAYATAWEAHERDGAPRPARDIDLDIFRALVSKETQVSTHTQYYHLVLTTIIMLARDFGFATYIDHGSFDSYLASELAEAHGVAAVLGPREVMFSTRRFDTDGQCHGSAWGFQQRGHPLIGFNTDAPVVPQEELALQAAMGVRYGMDDAAMDGVRGLTIVPAVVAGLSDRLGSLEPGKDADLVIVSGDPVDPRSGVESVFVEGRLVYDAQTQGRRW
jgi:imidazolonepropionase-like amidohydrolase